ncbi:MAG: hypothetical protein HY598_03610 [Candidatus Omnitrophica bacterium]|nr:hypothetical protein [Candidatus Omnitrophota bacterium]
MTAPRRLPLVPVAAAILLTAAALGAGAWRVSVRQLDERVEQRRSGLKRLLVSKIPPNEEAAAYLSRRQQLLERAYRQWQDRVIVAVSDEAVGMDPQLSVQERFHEVQRQLTRLAAARKIAVPQVVGFPKELPPSESAPRLLVQLALIEEAASLMLGQGVVVLSSLKIEDPEVLPPPEEGAGSFLVRQPVRVHFSASLPQAVGVLEALSHAAPLIDVRSAKIVSATDHLEVELLLARYTADARAQQLPPHDHSEE